MSLPQIYQPGTTENGADGDHLVLVRQAAQRGRERMAVATALAVAERAEEDARLAAAWNVANHALGLPSWTLQYIDTPEPGEDPDRCTVRSLELPACSPVIIRRDSRFNDWDTAKVYALIPTTLGDDPEWHIQHTHGPAYPLALLDLAIADASDAGPKWHALSLEAARLNERGPAPETPDLIDQTHTLIREFSAAGTEGMDAAVLVATGLLAVAEQVLRLREHLEQVEESRRDIAF